MHLDLLIFTAYEEFKAV